MEEFHIPGVQSQPKNADHCQKFERSETETKHSRLPTALKQRAFTNFMILKFKRNILWIFDKLVNATYRIKPDVDVEYI